MPVVVESFVGFERLALKSSGLDEVKVLGVFILCILEFEVSPLKNRHDQSSYIMNCHRMYEEVKNLEVLFLLS